MGLGLGLKLGSELGFDPLLTGVKTVPAFS